jgi:hypothetical protein
MKTINVDQPWAELIMQGVKTIELRKRRTNHTGQLAIRATKNILVTACKHFDLDPASLTTGAILGTVELVNVIEFDLDTWRATREQHLNPGFGPGKWLGWRLKEPRRLATPIPYRGLPGMFTLPAEIAAELYSPDD